MNLHDEGILLEAKPLTSYTSHSGTTSKLWILPDGRPVSIPGQHFEWALAHEQYLQHAFGVGLRHVRRQGDTAIRMQLLRHGFVRLNYVHKGGHLTAEAHHLHWGPLQIKGCRAVIRDNLRDISFVRVSLLNNRRLIVAEDTANLIGCSVRTTWRRLPLCHAQKVPSPSVIGIVRCYYDNSVCLANDSTRPSGCFQAGSWPLATRTPDDKGTV